MIENPGKWSRILANTEDALSWKTNNEDLCVLRNAGYGKLENAGILGNNWRKQVSGRRKDADEENTSEY